MNTGQKRAAFQRERDLVDVARWYLRGTPQMQIAAFISESREYSISQRQISADIKTLTRRWLESELVDINEAKTKELAKINHLERTYWEAWEESRKEKHITSTKRTTEGKDTKDEAGIRKEQQTGNPAYLVGVQWCINKRCDIFGLDAPKQIDHTWQDELEDAGYDAAAVFEEYVNAARIAQSRSAEQVHDGDAQGSEEAK